MASRIFDNVTAAVQKMVDTGEPVTASRLLELSEPEDAPSHDAFTWDNDIAGHEYRLIQARTWIRKIEVIVKNKPTPLAHVPSILTDVREGKYVPISIIKGGEYEAALNEAKKSLDVAINRVAQLEVVAKPKRKRAIKEIGRELEKSKEGLKDLEPA